jgi:hypothetical protein
VVDEGDFVPEIMKLGHLPLGAIEATIEINQQAPDRRDAFDGANPHPNSRRVPHRVVLRAEEDRCPPHGAICN